MTEAPAVYFWSEIRDRAVARFGRRIPYSTEAAILDVFHRYPAEVVAALEAIGDEIEAGTHRSGWTAARQRIEAIRAVATAHERALRNALRWARDVGPEYEREAEVDDELFGERGTFRAHPDIRERVLDEWRRSRAGVR